ncbi:hypothetical protein D6853_11460 [Butyrivibrio sp. X503]|uniref:hypothetical protein n=1 Tax=Butyrivibrio sp. X503 TaxID=2364878 RepID=UPI000EA86C1D|nr:hypothetical protein [Butyrivibrio sp. X503]RKM55327.1 hypothetical protein D6853_11460 [Butyrivibrio sp. X503]
MVYEWFFIYYADEAKDDLRNIFMYIAYDLGSRDNATGQVNRIREAISALVNFPKRNALVPYGARDLDRFFEQDPDTIDALVDKLGIKKE